MKNTFTSNELFAFFAIPEQEQAILLHRWLLATAYNMEEFNIVRKPSNLGGTTFNREGVQHFINFIFN